jgi:hypothetical protein
MVAASIAAIAAALGWRAGPTVPRAALVAACTGLALLLKPHAIFWLGPGLAVALLGRDSVPRPAARSVGGLIFLCLIALAAPAAWYAHAAEIHRQFPVAGATIRRGWVDPRLWLEPALYGRVALQIAEMVFTPAGLAFTAIALWRPRPRFTLGERALLAAGAGTIAQSLFFATRMFDDTARGTEYYQLAAVPAAALLIARGVDRFGDAVAAHAPGAARWASAAALAVLALGSGAAARPALLAPARYASLLDDCAEVRALTPPQARIFVLADRGGTVLYYCDRQGTTFTTATPLTVASEETRTAAGPEALSRALESATHVLLPFPEMAPPEFAAGLAQGWERVPTGRPGIELYARPGASPARQVR